VAPARRRLGKRALLLAALLCSPLAMAQITFQSVYPFSQVEGPRTPVGSVVEGDDGRLHGATALQDSSSQVGATWSINPDGSGISVQPSDLAFFNTKSAFVKTPNGRIYGVLSASTFPTGPSAIVRWSPTEAAATVAAAGGQVNFASGHIAADAAGNLYGFEHYNSGIPGWGAIWKLASDESTYTVLYPYGEFDGLTPVALMVGTDGWLYGVNGSGGTNNLGLIFKLRTDGTGFSVVHQFAAADGQPGQASYGGDSAILEADGWLYGTARSQGANNAGTVYRIRPDGSAFQVLHSFNNTPGNGPLTGRNPGGPLVRGPDGNLYGTAGGGDLGFGTLWRIVVANAGNPDGGFERLHSFSETDGSGPSGLTLASNGKLYGITNSGGSGLGGTIFELDTGWAPASPPPEITSFEAIPDDLVLGASSVLNWTATEAQTCSASGAWSGTRATSGTEAVTPTAAGDITYTLTCIGLGGEVSVSVTVTVTAPPAVPPVITQFTATPVSLTLGASSVLSWIATDAQACTASGAWSGTKATSGEESVTPAAAGEIAYTLTCTGEGGEDSASVTLAVSSPLVPPAITQFSAAPTSLTLGAGSVLSWTATDAQSCTASGAWSGIKETSGTETVTPTAAGNVTYTLACSGAGGEDVKDLAITVTQASAPPPSGGRRGGGGMLSPGALLGLGLLVLWRRRSLSLSR